MTAPAATVVMEVCRVSAQGGRIGAGASETQAL